MTTEQLIDEIVNNPNYRSWKLEQLKPVLEALLSGSGGSSFPYKSYVALLTQSGTSAPVATVLENTLGFDVNWQYSGVGYYRANNTGFTDKTAVFICPPLSSETNISQTVGAVRNSSQGGSVQIRSRIDGASANDVFFDTAIEIRVYE